MSGFGVDTHDAETLGNLLESFRTYLLMVANQELDPALSRKCGASDVVQETFFQAHRDRASFQGRSRDELRLWLREILLNNIRDVGRFYGQAKRRVEREVSIEEQDPYGLADTDPTPAARAVSQEQADALGDALARLPEHYRQAIELRSREGRGFDAIGAILGRSADAARMLWFRAIERLQHELAETGGT
jgi:RNA polymerase sigma-70 factor (ECF subfamily)